MSRGNRRRQRRFVARHVAAIRNPHTPETVDVPEDRARHILGGDRSGGGHRAGTGKPGKTEFPPGWDDAKIIAAIKAVAGTGEVKEPAHRRGELVISGVVDGVTIEAVVKQNGDVRTAYPVSGPGVVRNPRPTRRRRNP